MIKYFLFNKNKKEKLSGQIDTIENKIKEINLHEVKLKKISAKLDILMILSKKIKSQNEKTNNSMIKQKNNLNNINFLIQEQINIINKLSDDIYIYKDTLDKNIANFKLNKEKLLYIVNFIKEIKKYISEIEQSSNNVREKSDSILNISKTIKKVSSDSKLLSVNAQIEASKISGSKTGFSVISDEMVRMSEETRDNSILIDNTINTIIKDIENLDKNIELNAQKIEESINLCEVIVNFIEALNDEYKSNIAFFNRILDSMTNIISFIEKIKDSIDLGYSMSDDVFKNTSREYMAIEGFINETCSCKTDSMIKVNDSIINLNNEKLKILMYYYRSFNYDPLNAMYDDETLICDNIYHSLFEENNMGALTPILAKGWSDEESKTWTIYLKNNICFSNGDILTAEDVEFSILRAFLDGTSLPTGFFDMIEGYKNFSKETDILKTKISGIQVVNNSTIKFKLNREDMQFLNKLSSKKVAIISKKEYLSNKIFIGTGPYKIYDIQTKDKQEMTLTLRKNEYNTLNYPNIEEIEILSSVNFEDYLEKYSNEENSLDFDIIYPMPFYRVDDILHKNTNITIDYTNSYTMLIINFIAASKNKVIQNKDFRQSVFCNIKDMDLSINGNNDYYIKYNGLSTYWYNNNTTPPKYINSTPDLLKLNGELNIVTYKSTITESICKTIKRVLEKNGLKVNIHIDSYEGTLEKYDLSVAVLHNDGYNLYSQLYETISPPYGSYIQDTPIGKELQSLTSISNYKETIELLTKMEVKILKEYYNLPIFYIKRFVLRKNNIINISDKPLATLNLANLIKTK